MIKLLIVLVCLHVTSLNVKHASLYILVLLISKHITTTYIYGFTRKLMGHPPV